MRSKKLPVRPLIQVCRAVFVPARRSLLLALTALLLAPDSPAQAQEPKKIPRIGFLSGRRNPTPAMPDPNASAFRQGLRELGYTEGKNIVIEYRYAGGKLESIPSLVTELIRLKVAVVVSPHGGAVRAAGQATRTVPIVMVTNLDPVASGIVRNLAHAGGNITGLTRLTRESGGKRLELVKDSGSDQVSHRSPLECGR
jgi:putative ABC transport system substrate-binding protein